MAKNCEVYGDFLFNTASPDDDNEKLCKVFRVTFEWRKDVNIPDYKSP